MNNVRVLNKAVIFNKNQQLLALQRSKNNPARPLAWDLPGGNLKFGEKPLDCIKREILEETGLGVQPKVYYITSELGLDKKEFWVEVAYIASTTITTVKLSKEHCQYRWVSKKEFLSLESANYLKEFINNLPK
jgi:8-oxo-dGTP diphosphatase